MDQPPDTDLLLDALAQALDESRQLREAAAKRNFQAAEWPVLPHRQREPELDTDLAPVPVLTSLESGVE